MNKQLRSEAAKQLSFLSEISLPSYPLTLLSSFKRSAFTLAETLIVLAVVGIVAALTIPSLVEKHNEKVMVTKLLKMYSLLNNVYEHAILEDGEVSNWFLEADMTENNKIISDFLTRHLSVVKTCENDTYKKECLPRLYYLSSVGYDESHCVQKQNVGGCMSNVLKDGSIITVLASSNTKKRCWIYADLNGRKGPNVFGKDVFRFHLTPKGVFPDGKVAIDKKISDSYDNSCLTKNASTPGFGCTSWVIVNKNMDYLHCKNDLSWEGKRSCK